MWPEQAKGTHEATLQVLGWYPQRVLPRCTNINISHADLMWHLGTDERCPHGPMRDAHSCLCHMQMPGCKHECWLM